MQDRRNLVWMDMEMTGLDPETDLILEIATVVTDGQLRLTPGARVTARPSDAPGSGEGRGRGAR